MRSSRVVERKNDFELAVVIPTRLCYVYTAVSGTRGEVEQKRKARGDELDLDSHLSFPSTRSPSSSAGVFSSFSFSSTPCPFPYSHSHFSHSPLRKRSSSSSYVLRTLTRSTYRNKMVDNGRFVTIGDGGAQNFTLVSRMGSNTVRSRLLFIGDAYDRVTIDTGDHDSKSVRSLPLY